MPEPIIKNEGFLPLDESLIKHAPAQGGIEYQNDLPGHVHTWHQHSVHERLIIQSGEMSVEWVNDSNEVKQEKVLPGHVIELPAGTPHQSTAGSNGCSYLILPEGGKAAITSPYNIRKLC